MLNISLDLFDDLFGIPSLDDQLKWMKQHYAYAFREYDRDRAFLDYVSAGYNTNLAQQMASQQLRMDDAIREYVSWNY